MKAKIIPSIIFKINLVFLYFFGRKKLNKTMVVYDKVINTCTDTSSSETQSAKVPPKATKIKNISSKLNIIFNIFKEYLINIVTTYYKKEK